MAETEVNVAIAALIISLIALVVTTQQLLVQIFASADGYRQCAESVIGRWHKKRKRVWKWSEFRFETQYVTPQIVLLTPLEFEDSWRDHEKLWRITSHSLGINKHTEFSRSLGKSKHTELDHTVHEMYGQVRTQIEKAKGTVSELEKGPFQRSLPNSKRRIGARSDTHVTWLRLLRELHALNHSYWPHECSTCPTLADAYKASPEIAKRIATETGYWSDPSWVTRPSFNTSRTEIGIINRTWNWGFMPPDLTRPLAEVSMGDIVVLALRMGMQWRALDLESGKLQADGNGFNLTGFEARGLGIILRLTATEQHAEYRKLIPTREVDKMLLGILPGDPLLVRRDFPLITKEHSIQPIAHPQGLLAAIMSKENREAIGNLGIQEVRVDVITLLLIYLPLEGSTMTRYCFPGWSMDSSLRSVYTFWEGRLALHRALRERADSGMLSPELHKVLSDVLGMLDSLEREYTSDWYIRSDRKRIMRNQMGADAKIECMQDIREVYTWTQAWLKSHTFGSQHETYPTYDNLVAAHAYMAAHACAEAKAFIANESRAQDQQTMRKTYDINPDRHGARLNHEVYEIACQYVNHLHHDEHGIHAYLTENHTSVSVDESEAAWWVMQLRGIAWHLSVWHGETIVQDVLGEQLIPSSFYGNKSPVWIT